MGEGRSAPTSLFLLLLVFHLLPVVKANLKPEGRGARVLQPQICKEEWKMFSTLLFTNKDPRRLIIPGTSMKRELRQGPVNFPYLLTVIC